MVYTTRITRPQFNRVGVGILEAVSEEQCETKKLGGMKAGIEQFWLTLTPEICKKYIAHLHKVIPKIISVESGPNGY